MGQPAFDAVKQYLDDFYMFGPPDVLYKYDRMADELASEAARLINCQPDEVTYIKNTTEGINIASEALPLAAGDEVLVLGNEYPANLLPWLKKRQEGVKVQVIKGTDSAEAFQRLLQAITPRTVVVTISSAQYYDGFMANIGQLSGICRKNSIYLVVDAVQSVGVRKLDLQATPVDFLVCGGQKYLQAGVGCGFLYVNAGIMPHLRHTKVGIRSMESFDDDSYTLKTTAGRFQDGTQNLAGIVALHAALKHVNTVGMEAIEHKNIGLLHAAKSYLTDCSIPFIDYGDRQSNIVSLKVSDPSGLAAFLQDQSVYIKPIKDVARLSFNNNSRPEDIETLSKLTRQWLSR